MVTVLFVMLFCCYTITCAQTPSSIKVGLESISKNTTSVKLSSDTNMQIGYYRETGFIKIGTLDDSEITVKRDHNTYYDLGVSFISFEEAKAYAVAHQGVPVCMGDNQYGVYATSDYGLPKAKTFNRTLAVYDRTGTLLLISHEDNENLVFRGYDTSAGLNLTTVGDKKYRGAIGMGGTSGLTPYNVLDLESYLYGVVPKEMPSSWPMEALKAQAVAARSIATYQYNRYLSSGYNVVDTTTTQVYGGYNAEAVSTNNAVNNTKGQVIRYNGKVAEALYFSTSGGITEDAKNVWGNDITYLRSVKDTYETEPAQKPWTRTITLSEIDKCLANYGANIGKAQGIQVVSRTDSGRVQELNILGTSGKYNVKGETIRSFFSRSSEGSLKSRLFSFSNTGNNNTSLAITPTEVTVISANGTATMASKDLVVQSAEGVASIAESFTVQSATNTAELTTTNKITQTANVAQETVWGDFTIYGQGYGHGVGMSQSGAK